VIKQIFVAPKLLLKLYFKIDIFSESGINDRPVLIVDTTTIQGGKDSCPRCGGSVFHAEKMLSKNNVNLRYSLINKLFKFADVYFFCLGLP